MIKIEHTEVLGWEHAIRGMRNPMNSWEKSDSEWCNYNGHAISCVNCKFFKHCETNFKQYILGPNDHNLTLQLAKAGTDHAKFRRMITVYADLTAPLYWWKEFDTYKVGTVANSCSTMHKIAEKEFTLDDFSCEYLLPHKVMADYNRDCFVNTYDNSIVYFPLELLEEYIIDMLNRARKLYLETGDKIYWWQMIQLLPSSYNQKRTVMLNYEVLANIYKSRKDHKLDEWREFCKWIEGLPYSEIITLKTKGVEVIEY